MVRAPRGEPGALAIAILLGACGHSEEAGGAVRGTDATASIPAGSHPFARDVGAGGGDVNPSNNADAQVGVRDAAGDSSVVYASGADGGLDASWDTGWDGNAAACVTTQPAVTSAVVADLAQALSIHSGQIQIVCTQPMTWPDGCLGIPAPELCAPGPTPGYLIVLQALGKQYVYHASQTGSWRYAGPGKVPTP